MIRELPNVKNIEIIKQQKWKGVGHIATMKYNGWCKRLIEWCSRNNKC